MTPLWTSDAIAAATGGTAHGAFTVDNVAFDSREIIGGELFIAMRGDTTNGHRFIDSALQRGAAGILCETAIDAPHVRVTDSFAALEALGRAARARTGATIIGVTGSVGKTGVKEAIRLSLLQNTPAVHASVKSYNNHSGVPLSLARMPADSRFGVFEMGMNHAGEIAALTRQVRPHVALITWVAPVHIEFFDSEAGIAHAKAEIFEGLEPGGTAIIPADNPHIAILRAAAQTHAARTISFGATGDVRPLSVAMTADGTDITADIMGETLAFRVGMAGAHWVNNALAVLATVKAAGGDIAAAGLALADLNGLPGRGARLSVAVRGGHATLLDESYNANPASMAASLAVLGSIAAPRRLAILGQMGELGEGSAAYHAGLAAPIAAAKVDALALVGPAMEALKLPNATHLATAADALAWARETLRPGDVCLVKGSNAVGLGTLVKTLGEND
ncbi:UDP-N-acetylmuramoyl-tripeptide--D-alanyl-D-alanine ligase [Sandaracinobacteroides saxicola]|uniref:UDP-N-acetylmuramoyl-tripeptide--D-alanyl-D-alanine ligase n=1 Tax=Sandaracinobacteroides saxicola TaxID=2759707 RepID=A0A7G5IG87_9SPHN|nr:UDP-N-acetylmuramoyl-tripeptide--D-alanyl-D-alanine ligase [Sandaracinobacteroides saxicola]QMW22379.1 UDP-N-acetylmuramoyl-tripeptide--D-alanyl-D-alanine ligase [Sandaracinobacteroides saxicola]